MTDRDTEREKAKENAERYTYARDHGHMDFVSKSRKCEAFYHGYDNKQWDESAVQALKAQNKPVLTINKIFPILTTVMGEQLQNTVSTSFRAASGGDPEVAKTLDKVWLYIANTNMLNFVRSEVADDGLIKSRGFFDVRIRFNESMQGDISIRKEHPHNAVLDPDGTSYDPDEWKETFISKWVAPNDIKVLYGKEDVAKALADRTRSHVMEHLGYDFIDTSQGSFGNVMQRNTGRSSKRDPMLARTVRLIERQYKEAKRVEHFLDIPTGEFREVPTNWSRAKIAHVLETVGPSMVVVPRVTEVFRWTVSADDWLLFDAVTPYRHFTLVPYFPVLRDGATIGWVENLLSPQENLNKISSQELHILNTTSNSGWRVRSGSLQNMTVHDLENRGGETGLVVELDDIEALKKIEPNQIPSGLDRAGFKADGHLDTISNVGDSMRGQDRADVSGRAIERKVVRSVVNLAKPLSNLLRTDMAVAKCALSLIQRYFTEPRILTITNEDPRGRSEEVSINQPTPEGTILNDLTIGEYSVHSTMVPIREEFEETQFEHARILRQELGVPVPDSFLIKNSKLADKDELIATLEEGGSAREELEQLEIAKEQAELEKLKTDNMVRRTDAMEKIARATKTTAEAEGGNGEGDKLEELRLQKYEIDQKLAFEKQKHEDEMEMKRAELQQERLLERAKMRLQQRSQTNAG